MSVDLRGLIEEENNYEILGEPEDETCRRVDVILTDQGHVSLSPWGARQWAVCGATALLIVVIGWTTFFVLFGMIHEPVVEADSPTPEDTVAF